MPTWAMCRFNAAVTAGKTTWPCGGGSEGGRAETTHVHLICNQVGVLKGIFRSHIRLQEGKDTNMVNNHPAFTAAQTTGHTTYRHL